MKVCLKMPLDDADIPALLRGVRLHRDTVRDVWVLLAPERALVMNDIGSAILTEVDGARSFGEIVTRLAKRFNAPADKIRADASAFLESLITRVMAEVRT